MTPKQREAVELLMSHPDSVTAEMLGITLATLRRWMRRDDFADALRAQEREQRAAAARIARQAVVNAAAALCRAVDEHGKPDAKILLEVLKASGALEAGEDDSGQALAEIIRRVNEAAADDE